MKLAGVSRRRSTLICNKFGISENSTLSTVDARLFESLEAYLVKLKKLEGQPLLLLGDSVFRYNYSQIEKKIALQG